MGYAGAVWIALAAALALWTRAPLLRTTVVTAACVWSSDLVTQGLKAAVDRPRPFERLGEADPLIGGTLGSSFPSGHAATSAAGAIAIAVLLRRAVALLAPLAAAVAFSRVYVGVHYPLDVLGGAAVGAAVGLGVLAAIRALRTPSAARQRSGGARSPG